jgi:phage terminase small subunit
MVTPKQERFVQEYLQDLNAKAAYRRAGYKPKSDGAAGAAASRLLKNVKVQALLQTAKSERSERTKITIDSVIQELARLAFADPRKLCRPDGTLKAITELDDDTAAAVASLEVLEEWQGQGEARRQVGVTKKLKQWDKGKALALLLAHLGDKPLPGVNVNVVNYLNISIEQFRQMPVHERVRLLREAAAPPSAN